MSEQLDGSAESQREKELQRVKNVQEEAKKFQAASKTFSPLRQGMHGGLRKLPAGKTVAVSGKFRDLVTEEEVTVDVEKEYKILEEAHRVLLQKQGMSARNPVVKEKEFIDYTSVREMIDEIGRPVLDTIPSMQAQMSQFKTDLAGLRDAISRTKADISMFASRTQDMNEFAKALQRLETQQGVEVGQIKTALEQLSILSQQTRGQVGEFHDVALAQNKKLEEQNLRISAFRDMIATNHKEMEETFTSWRRTYESESRRLLQLIQDCQAQQSASGQTIRAFQRDMGSSFRELVLRGQQHQKLEEERYEGLDRKLQVHSQQLVVMKQLAANMDILMKETGTGRQVALFVSQTLPIMVHLAICEGLDKVVGRDYKANLLEFETSKITELHDYITNRANTKCIKIMHERLLTFTKFFKANAKGVLPFTFGADVHKDMGQQELTRMSQAHFLTLARRHEVQKEQAAAFEEAWEQVRQEGRFRSEALIKHKLKRLELPQLLQLRKQVLEIRIMEKGLLDDLHVAPAQVTEDGQLNKKKDKEKKKVDLAPKVFPSQVAMFHIDKLRPYQRLDRKYQTLLLKYRTELEKFKEQDVNNFSKTTKMVMELGNELTLVKSVIEAIQSEFDEDSKVNHTKFEKEKDQFGAFKEEFAKEQQTIQSSVSALEAYVQKFQTMVYGNQGRVEKQIDSIKSALSEVEHDVKIFSREQNCSKMKAKELCVELDTQAQTRGLLQPVSRSNVGQGHEPESAEPYDDAPDEEAKARRTPTRLETMIEMTPSSAHAGQNSLQSSSRSQVLNTSPSSAQRAAAGGRLRIVNEADLPEASAVQSAMCIAESGERSPANIPSAATTQNQEDLKINKAHTDQLPAAASKIVKNGVNLKEEKRKREERIRQRTKEREIQEQKRQAQQELELKEKQKREDLEQRRMQAELAQQQKVEEKARIMQVLRKESRVTAMSAHFIGELKAEKDKRKQQQMQTKDKQRKRNGRATLAPSSRQVHNRLMGQTGEAGQAEAQGYEPGEEDPGLAQANMPEGEHGETCQSVAQALHVEEEDEDQIWSAFSGADFVGLQQSNQVIDVDKVQEIIRPELARLYGSLADMKEAMIVKVENDNKQLQADIEKLKATDAAKTKQLEALVKEFTFQGKDLTINLERLKAQMNFELGNMASTNEADKQEMAKIRKGIAVSVQNELVKPKGLDTNIKYEFSRINSSLNKSIEAIKLLMEDQMIMQMMQEQEIIDRKQISLLGLKRNQQILGTNQYAMQNHLSASGEHNFWNERNKTQEYNSIVKPVVESGQNARGFDYKTNQKKEQFQEEIRNQNQAASGLENSILSQTLSSMTREAKSGAENAVSFIERYQRPDEHNSLLLDRSCASCMTGFAPQILTHIKLACLHYVNQPVRYHSFMLQFHELLQIKEHILTKCQNTMNGLTKQMETQPSMFRSADAKNTFTIAKEVVNADDRELDADLVQIEALGDDGLPSLFAKQTAGKSDRRTGESLTLDPAKKKQQKAQDKNAKKKEMKLSEPATFRAMRGQEAESLIIESPRQSSTRDGARRNKNTVLSSTITSSRYKKPDSCLERDHLTSERSKNLSISDTRRSNKQTTFDSPTQRTVRIAESLEGAGRSGFSPRFVIDSLSHLLALRDNSIDASSQDNQIALLIARSERQRTHRAESSTALKLKTCKLYENQVLQERMKKFSKAIAADEGLKTMMKTPQLAQGSVAGSPFMPTCIPESNAQQRQPLLVSRPNTLCCTVRGAQLKRHLQQSQDTARTITELSHRLAHNVPNGLASPLRQAAPAIPNKQQSQPARGAFTHSTLQSSPQRPATRPAAVEQHLSRTALPSPRRQAQLGQWDTTPSTEGDVLDHHGFEGFVRTKRY